MDDLLEFSEKPVAAEIYMIAGWRQWADAGSTSSALPQYLVEQVGAKKIGRIKSEGFYLFQLPGYNPFLRPEIKLEDGHRKELRHHQNEFYYWGHHGKGLIIFLGDEPHLSVERYAEAFFHAVRELGVKRVAVIGGVYGMVPYDRDRQISCMYSLPRMKAELEEYAVRFSNYEGGVSIGSYLADKAEQMGIEYFGFYAFVPMYDLSRLAPQLEGISIEKDFKAWHDLMRRLNHMFGLGLDLSDLEQQSEKLAESMSAQIDELEKKMPQLHFREHLKRLADEFTEMSFMPLDDVWGRELGDIFKDLE